MLSLFDGDAAAFERLSLKKGIALERLAANERSLLSRVFISDCLTRHPRTNIDAKACEVFLKEITPWLDTDPKLFLDAFGTTAQNAINQCPNVSVSDTETYRFFLQEVETMHQERIEHSKQMREALRIRNRSEHGDHETDSERSEDEHWMRLALEAAREAAQYGEVPVGAVLVSQGKVLAKAGNRVVSDKNPCAHAEILAVTDACRVLHSERLPAPTLYVTLEPCPMCTAALANARVRRIVWGAPDSQCGACGGAIHLTKLVNLHHNFLCRSGVLEQESKLLLKEFFASCRAKTNPNN